MRRSFNVAWGRRLLCHSRSASTCTYLAHHELESAVIIHSTCRAVYVYVGLGSDTAGQVWPHCMQGTHFIQCHLCIWQKEHSVRHSSIKHACAGKLALSRGHFHDPSSPLCSAGAGHLISSIASAFAVVDASAAEIHTEQCICW